MIVTLDGKDIVVSIDELMVILEKLDGVHGVHLIAME